MDLEQIKELIAQLEKSTLKKLVVKKGDFEIALEKEGELFSPIAHLPPHYHPARAIEHTSAHAPVQIETKSVASPVSVAVEGKCITSPMVGTFFAASAPDQPPFIKIGDQIEENQVVCVIEAMKVMNEVKAGMSGTVAEILVDNAQPVEFGSKIFRIV